MLGLAERLKAQNTGEPWIDCNQRPGRKRPHRWVFESVGTYGVWYRCKRCPVGTCVKHGTVDSMGHPVFPSPFLR